MPTLYEQILPRLQDIHEEGGNMSAHLVSRVALDALDAEATSNPNAASLVSKIEETLRAYGGKRDHARFNAFFEAYTEALVFLAARHRHVALRAIPDGGKHGKTSDFETLTIPAIGLEVKTLNPVNPVPAIDDAMNRGFEAGYEAEQRSREAAKTSPNGVGIGFGETTWAPHGAGAEETDALTQTMSKISSNIKAGQYAGKPTFLVVSLSRLGVRAGSEQLQRWVEDEDGRRSGHLYTIAAQPLDTAVYGHTRDSWDGPVDLGVLPRVGVLRDHPFIAGVIFVNQVGSEANSVDYLSYAIRLHGVWNTDWERDALFSDNEKQAAKQLFKTLCDATNDLDDGGSADIVNDRPLHSAFYRHLDLLKTWQGAPASGPNFEAFMVEAERLHFAWRGALRKVDVALNHTMRDPADIITGVRDDGRPVLAWAGAQPHPRVPPMALVKLGRQWALDEAVETIRPADVVL